MNGYSTKMYSSWNPSKKESCIGGGWCGCDGTRNIFGALKKKKKPSVQMTITKSAKGKNHTRGGTTRTETIRTVEKESTHYKDREESDYDYESESRWMNFDYSWGSVLVKLLIILILIGIILGIFSLVKRNN